MIQISSVFFLFFFLCFASSSALTIAEKKEGVSSSAGSELTPEMKELLKNVNAQIAESKKQLAHLYNKAERLREADALPSQYDALLRKMKEIRLSIRQAEEQWRQQAVSSGKNLGYSLWNQPETTIGQLIDDYGSDEYIYMMSPEIAKMPISIDSNLPVPYASWSEILELILSQSGIGIKQVNPYLRELFFVQGSTLNLKAITASREELNLFDLKDRVAFVLHTDPTELTRVWHFLNRFVNPATTTLQLIGREILIVAKVAEIKELLKIYEFVSSNKGSVEYRAVRIHKIDAEEMAKALSAIFEGITEAPKSAEATKNIAGEPQGKSATADIKGQAAASRQGQNAYGPLRERSQGSSSGGVRQQVYGSSHLKIITLKDVSQALVLIGTKEEIDKAEEIIRQIEMQIGKVREKVIFWYTVKHSDPEELAQVVSKIYDLMIATNAKKEGALADTPEATNAASQQAANAASLQTTNTGPLVPLAPFPTFAPPRDVFSPYPYQGYYTNGRNYFIDSDEPKAPKPPPNQGRDNFIVDPKTNALVMVVEADILQELKDLIKKLDVPKKMVQIEVMLVEQVLTHNDALGLNLLRLGSAASQTDATQFVFDVASLPVNGIGEFIVSRKKSGRTPAYDMAYQFLVSRDDVRINASPSLLTVNQTQGTIEIETEISISVGTFLVPNGASETTQQSFIRQAYGIKIDVTPTVHMSNPENDAFGCGNLPDYITLDSEIKFETIITNVVNNTQPPVIRRVLKNQARVADGQTVIIGGFRRKDSSETTQSIPFLGELPGIGKLFSDTTIRDEATEMFLFMTSKIVSNPEDELERIKMEEMSRRAGDLPYFMKALVEAREREESELFQGSLTLLFGQKPPRLIDTEAVESMVDIGECSYDGR